MTQEHEITHRQKKLLIQLVHLAREARLPSVIVPIPDGPDHYVVYVRGRPSLTIYALSDLDALCRAELLGYQLNRWGTGKRYLLTKASFKVVDLWLTAPAADQRPPWMRHPSGEVLPLVPVPELLQQFHQLRRQLRHQMTPLLPNTLLPEMFDELQAVARQVEAVYPQTAEVAAHLQSLGRKLLDRLADPHQAPQVTQALATFGAWSHLIYQILARTPAP